MILDRTRSAKFHPARGQRRRDLTRRRPLVQHHFCGSRGLWSCATPRMATGSPTSRYATPLSEAGLAAAALPPLELIRRTAGLLADGKIVGWFQGRMEFGPRALGNRSILADPRRPEMREVLAGSSTARASARSAPPSSPKTPPNASSAATPRRS